MYFLIISFGIYSFFFSKMFIFFPKESCLLLQITMPVLIKSISIFNVGVSLGKFTSIINLKKKIILISVLIMVWCINILFITQYKLQFLFISLRFILGVCLGFIITLYLKNISQKYISNIHEKYIRILFNYQLIALPIWFFFKLYIPMYYWLYIILILVTVNIIVLIYTQDNSCEKHNNKNIYMKFDYQLIKNFGSIFIFITTIIVMILFLSTLILLSHQKNLSFYNLDIIHLFLKHCFNANVIMIYEQIPFFISMICFFLPQNIKLYILCILPISLLSNYFFLKSITLFSLNNGLIYALYVMYAPYFATFLKDITSHVTDFGSLICYAIKSFLSFIIQYYFLSFFYNLFIQNNDYYIFITIIFLLVIISLILIFENLIRKLYLSKFY
jgi:hypothetical protein